MAASSQELKSPFSDICIERPGREFAPGPISSTRWFNTGLKASGKTTLLSEIPDCLVFDYEGKFRMVPSPACSYVVPRTLEQHDRLVDWLCEEGKAGRRVCSMVGWDTADEFLYGLLIPGLTEWLHKNNEEARKKGTDIREYKSGGKGSGGWDMVTTRFLSYLKRLHLAGYGWFVNGHVREMEGRMRPAVNPGIYGGLWRAAEFVTGTVITARSVPTEETITISVGAKSVRKVVKRERTERIGVIEMVSKQPDDVSLRGGNLALPDSIELKLGQGWSAVTSAYEHAVRQAAARNHEEQ